ncbi:MAG: hypothetical protein ACJA01_004444, partial [Saprospiraceae bacterium]
YEAYEKRIHEHILNKSAGAVTVVPVVFHIVHDGDAIGSGENISDTYIHAQLMQLNDDFRRRNSDGNNIWNQAADTEIEFCLASKDPSGNVTSGIVRHDVEGGPWLRSDFESQVKIQTIWNRDLYLNIWSADLSGNLLGYAQFPNGPPNTDGVVCLATSFGSLTSPQPGGAPFNEGRTLTHEVGHCLGLYHIWGDVNGCNGTDEVDDTPNQEESSSGCPTGVQLDDCATSAPGYMYQNYMDYSFDDCMNLFTAGQMARMKAAIAELRNQLNSNKCSNGPSEPLAANYSPDNGSINVCPEGTIQFTNLSTGPVTARLWNFSGVGVSPTSSTIENPIVKIGATGTLNITLTVTDNNDIVTKNSVLPVTILDNNHSSCKEPPCLDFDVNGGPYADLYAAEGVSTNCEVVVAQFEVYSSEAYILPSLLAGTSYTLEFCDGYDIDLWDAVMTIGKYDLENDKAFSNSDIAHANHCSLTFTPTESYDYIAVISTAGECNGVLDERENGSLSFYCNSLLTDIRGLAFVDDGGRKNSYRINQNKVYTLCPSDSGCEKLSLIFSDFDLDDSPGCSTDYMIIYDGLGTDKEIIGTYCGANSPGAVVSGASSGCLTIEFVSDDMTSFSEGWIATIDCLDDSSCLNECPEGYALSGIEDGTGGPLNSGDYNTDGLIFSSQTISAGDIQYNAKESISLMKEFLISSNTSFSASLDGCITGSGSRK